jgi:hypothetical protein
MLLGHLAERAVGERHHGGVVVGAVGPTTGSKPSRSSSAHQRLEARRGGGVGPGIGGASGTGRPRRHRRDWRPSVRPCAAPCERATAWWAVRGRATGRRRPASTGAAGGRRRRGRRPPPAAGPRRASARGGGARCWGAGRAISATSAVVCGRGDRPAPGRWRSACCRRAPSARRVAAWRRQHETEITRNPPVKCPSWTDPDIRSPHRRRGHGAARGVIDPELGADIVELGMATGVDRHRRRRRHRSA